MSIELSATGVDVLGLVTSACTLVVVMFAGLFALQMALVVIRAVIGFFRGAV